jgi:hypothetical protein
VTKPTTQPGGLQELERDANAAIEAARDDPTAGKDAVNWGDIGVTYVGLGDMLCRGETTPFALVVCEEASPEAHQFCRFVQERLADEGWLWVDVRTEW